MRNKKYVTYICAYTFFFGLVFITGYMSFFKHGKSFIWYDGYMQHYPAMVYIGRQLRETAAGFLSGDFSIPMFEFNLGMGQSIIPMLNLFDGLGDPFVLLTVFIPVEHTEILYNALVVVKMYLSGIGFSLFCFYFKKTRAYTLIGALIYAFCSYALYAGVRHPSFINPMIYFPFLLIGIDKVIKNEKPWIFIVTVFIAAMNGFYFLYVATIFVFLYAVLRYISLNKGSKAKEFFMVFFRGMTSYLLGIMMSAIIFIPAVIGFLNSARSESKVNPGNLLLYNIAYYGAAFLKSVSPSGSWKYISLAAICIFAAVILILRRDNRLRQIRIALITGILFYFIPFGGYMTNGFSYVSGRWTFVFSFILAFIVVCMLPVLQNLSRKELLICGIIVAAYGLAGLTHPSVRDINTVYGFAVLAVSFLTIAIIQHNTFKALMKSIKIPDNSLLYRKGAATVVCVLVLVNLSFNANLLFGKKYNNYVSEFEDYGVVLEGFRTSEVAAALPLPDGNFYRVDSIARFFQNAPLILNYPSVTAYFSIINASVSQTLYGLEDSQLSQAYNLFGLDNRASLDTLSSVKYISAEDGVNDEYVPYGFVSAYKKVKNKKHYTVYENRYALPLGYTYSTYITFDEYNKMNALQKQEAMLQSVVLDKEIYTYSRGKPLTTSKKIDCTISETDGAVLNGNELVIEKNNAVITISFNGLPDSETYLRLNNFDINDSGHRNFYIDVSSGKVKKTCRVMSDSYNFSLGRKNYLVNLGYSEKGKNTASVRFPLKGKFKLDGIEIYCQPMENYAAQVQALAEEPMENIKITTNKVSGTIDLSQDKILVISIGYSAGWTAKVDGQKVDILKANGMFLGIPLDKGYHEIDLTYCTPGIKCGLLLSAAGIIIFIIIIIYDRKKI